jgi:hypothetical protein
MQLVLEVLHLLEEAAQMQIDLVIVVVGLSLSGLYCYNLHTNCYYYEVAAGKVRLAYARV